MCGRERDVFRSGRVYLERLPHDLFSLPCFIDLGIVKAAQDSYIRAKLTTELGLTKFRNMKSRGTEVLSFEQYDQSC